MSLVAFLLGQLRARGPMNFSEFMEHALAHPDYGYYRHKDPLGVQGDFTTAPEISQIFGELIGAWMADAWQAQGSKKAVLMELGPGRGTLMGDALRATRAVAGFHDAIDIRMVETSPTLRAKQEAHLKNMHPCLHWQEEIGPLPRLPLFFIANEFFDALPVRQYVYTQKGWCMRMVAEEKGELAFKLSSPFLHAPVSSSRHGTVKEGDVIELCPMAEKIIHQLAQHIATYGGAGLIIDYGYSEPHHGDSVQAVHHHAFCPVLARPGEADITAHVNFTALARSARHAGASPHGPITQADFLRKSGAQLRAARLCSHASPEQQKTILEGLERLLSPAQMGELFKVLAITPQSLMQAAGF